MLLGIACPSALVNGNDDLCHPEGGGDTLYTPLHVAAEYGREFTAELLVRQSADVNVRDSEGGEPLTKSGTLRHSETAVFVVARKIIHSW